MIELSMCANLLHTRSQAHLEVAIDVFCNGVPLLGVGMDRRNDRILLNHLRRMFTVMVTVKVVVTITADER